MDDPQFSFIIAICRFFFIHRKSINFVITCSINEIPRSKGLDQSSHSSLVLIFGEMRELAWKGDLGPNLRVVHI